jgi:hypothetical protein
MTTVAASAPKKALAGFGKEGTKGVVAAPTLWMPVRDFTYQDLFAPLRDEGSRGGNVDVYNILQGVGHSECSWNGDWFPDSSPLMLGGILGDVATVGASAPYAHTFANTQANGGQPGSWTGTFIDPLENRQLAGLQISELGLVIDRDTLATYSAKAIGWPSAAAAGPFTPAPSAILPLEGWRFAATLGGVATPQFERAEINVKRAGTEAFHTTQGTQSPAGVSTDELGVDGKVSYVADSVAQITNYLNNTNLTLVIAALTAAGAGQVGLSLTMTKLNYTTAQKNYGGKKIMIDVNFTASGNTTDVGATGGYSQVKALATNAKPSGTFG